MHDLIQVHVSLVAGAATGRMQLSRCVLLSCLRLVPVLRYHRAGSWIRVPMQAAVQLTCSRVGWVTVLRVTSVMCRNALPQTRCSVMCLGRLHPERRQQHDWLRPNPHSMLPGSILLLCPLHPEHHRCTSTTCINALTHTPKTHAASCAWATCTPSTTSG